MYLSEDTCKANVILAPIFAEKIESLDEDY
jgi:hypothetical protein